MHAESLFAIMCHPACAQTLFTQFTGRFTDIFNQDIRKVDRLYRAYTSRYNPFITANCGQLTAHVNRTCSL